MSLSIESVELVSDGIMVRFSNGLLSYFSQQFLRDHVGVGSNQIFLEAEAVPESRSRLPDTPVVPSSRVN